MKHRLLKNILYLFSLQGVTYLLPLITIPYLMRVVGVEKFGIISFATAITQLFIVITDYGFNLSATKDISINRDNKNKICIIFNEVLFSKILLLSICCLLLLVSSIIFDKIGKYFTVYFLSFGLVLGYTLFPIWFFMGIERMKFITYTHIFAKTISTISIFVFVKTEKDFLLVPAINSMWYIVSGMICLAFAVKLYNIKIQFPTHMAILHSLKKSWDIFVTSFLTNILSSAGVFVLGIFGSNTEVGYFAAIEKIIKAITGLFKPITQSLFPYISSRFGISYKEGKVALVKSAWYLICSALIVGAFALKFREEIINIAYGNEVSNFDFIFVTLIIWMIVGVINNIIGIQYLLAIGENTIYKNSFILASFITIFLFLILTPTLKADGVCIGMLTGEISLLTTMVIYIFYRQKRSRLETS